MTKLYPMHFENEPDVMTYLYMHIIILIVSFLLAFVFFCESYSLVYHEIYNDVTSILKWGVHTYAAIFLINGLCI